MTEMFQQLAQHAAYDIEGPKAPYALPRQW